MQEHTARIVPDTEATPSTRSAIAGLAAVRRFHTESLAAAMTDLAAAAETARGGGRAVLAATATYLQWLDFGGLGLEVEPADWLLQEARVAVNSGVPFGGQPGRFARLNFATTRALLDVGLGRIERALTRRRG